MEKNGLYYDMIPAAFKDGRESNLVFVHGSGCNRRFLRALAKQLPDYNCYLPDLPDHGKSEIRNCTKAEDYVDAIAEFVSDMENVTIVGHSLGGTICLGVAAKNLPSVKKCVIISSGARYNKMDQRIHDMVARDKVDWGYLIKCLGSYYDPETVKDFLKFEAPEIILQDFKIDLELNLEYTLDKIEIPTLIMVGKADILTLPEYSVKMRKGIKNSRLVYFPRVRHMLPIARRKAVSGLIRDFVE